LLRGSIGAGKSVFARGVAEGLGANFWQGSPTFALIHEYDSSPPLYHADLYRLAKSEIEGLGLQEYAAQNSILLIEWADRAQEHLAHIAPGGSIWVDIGYSGNRERVVTIHAESRKAPAFAEGLLV
jgi:tRNA threonylcarbamoyladenosine biosynthesis protein TsaE